MRKAPNPTGKGGFQKGQVANPTGRPKEFEEIKKLAKEHSEEAFMKIVSIMRTADDHKTGLAAANSILDRAIGKPAQSVDISDDTGTIASAILQIVKANG